ncbi:MAG TPA: hypothetical protein VFM93_12575 [Candidatus Limnocylindria bacterium]|nr:hypothetical protein [Candidatus Limnocylindria bacterium]
MTRRDWLAATLVGVGVVLARLPFAARELWAWDSVLYARALEGGFHVGFDLDAQRPHAPGYILYVALADLFRRSGADASQALVVVSILASGLGAAALFLLARRFTSAPVAALAALGYALNPLAWMYGEIAYPYALLGALAVTLAGAFWWARHQADARATYLVSFAFGLVSGFRQDLLLLLGVLWLWTAWPRGPRAVAASGALVLGGIAVWLVPSAALSGGLVTYLQALGAQTDFVRTTYSVPAQGVDALSYNLRFTVYALAWGLLGFGVLLVGLLLTPVLAWLRAPSRIRAPRPEGPAAFFLAWLAPGLLFYVLVHIGEWGYVLSVLPGLYVLTAALTERLVRRVDPAGRRAWSVAGAALVLVPALLFVGTPQRFSAAAIASHDTALRARVDYVKRTFDAEQTVILAREDFLLVRYYLPRYRAWLYDPQPHGTEAAKRKRAMRTTAMVIFTDGLVPRQGLELRSVEVAPGIRLAYVPLEPGSVIEFYGNRYTVRERQ